MAVDITSKNIRALEVLVGQTGFSILRNRLGWSVSSASLSNGFSTMDFPTVAEAVESAVRLALAKKRDQRAQIAESLDAIDQTLLLSEAVLNG